VFPFNESLKTMAEVVHMANEALKRTTKDVAERLKVPGCIILTDDGGGGVRMAVVGLSSERTREVLCVAIGSTTFRAPDVEGLA
jgi:hypothetical protein